MPPVTGNLRPTLKTMIMPFISSDTAVPPARHRLPTLHRRIASLACATLLAGCTAATVSPPPASAPADGAAVSDRPGDAYYRQAAARGERVLRIDPQRSLITVVVRRGGTLARLGHDHVVASHNVEGHAAPELGRADFQFALEQMTVDEADLRSAARFDTQPTAQAVSGTRHNMLTRVLDAAHYPLAVMAVTRLADSTLLSVSITLHGVTRTQRIPVQITDSGSVLTASGSVVLKQSDFGITPFAIMGGAIAVQDQMELKFTLVAVPHR